MLTWDKFETKESWGVLGEDDPPAEPGRYPWDSNWIVGITYSQRSPEKLITPDEAYQLSLSATYWWFNVHDRRWFRVGGPCEVLYWMRQVTSLEEYEDWRVSWPDPFPNHHQFGNPQSYQVQPFRELLRRHFDQDAYATDVDLQIERTRGRRKRINGNGK